MTPPCPPQRARTRCSDSQADDFEDLHPGRRIVFTYPAAPRPPERKPEDSSEGTVFGLAETAPPPRYTVTVLDALYGEESKLRCSAMVVPRGKEEEWVYSAVGGQWQLLADAATARLIVISRIIGRGTEGGAQVVPADTVAGTVASVSDEGVKEELRKLIWALAPRKCFEEGAAVCFISYSDNVVQRCVVEVAESPFLGEMVVEDVEVAEGESSEEEEDNTGSLPSTMTAPAVENSQSCGATSSAVALVSDGRSGGGGEERALGLGKRRQRTTVFLRRLRFKRMPNLIQTEVPLAFGSSRPVVGNGKFRSDNGEGSRRLCDGEVDAELAAVGADVAPQEDEGGSGGCDGAMCGTGHTTDLNSCEKQGSGSFSDMNSHAEEIREPLHLGPVLDRGGGGDLNGGPSYPSHDHLVHKYLPPIVAGLVLASPVLDSYLRAKRTPRVLTVGIGGGALPTFLRRHFPFHIHAVDLDEVVVGIARRHFGLKEDSRLSVTVADGAALLMSVADDIVEQGIVSAELAHTWRSLRRRAASLATVSATRRRERQRRRRSPSSSSTPVSSSSSSEMSSGSDISTDTSAHMSDDSSGGSSLDSSGDDTSASASETDVGSGNSEEEGESGRSERGVSRREMMINPLHMSVVCERGGSIDSRYHVIVIDVDAGDATRGLYSPPREFLRKDFLTAARISLVEGGMLVMNVVPWGRASYERVVACLRCVFGDMYETSVDGDVNRVVFAIAGSDRKDGGGAQGVQEEEGIVKKIVRNIVDGSLVSKIMKM